MKPGVAAGGIDDRADDARVDVAVLLRQIVAIRQLDGAVPGPDFGHARTDQSHRTLAVETRAHARRIAGVGREPRRADWAGASDCVAIVEVCAGTDTRILHSVYVNVNWPAPRSRFGGALAFTPCRRRLRHCRSSASISASTMAMSSCCCASIARRAASTSRNLISCGRSLLRRLVQIEQLADLRQRQAEPLAAQDELDAHPLALAVDSAAPAAPRRQQSFVLIEPDRAGRQREFLGEIGDTVGDREWPGRHR